MLTIAKVALGLGFVIFIHELGHFLLAKWNGVKVEKFSIGFGPTLFGFRRGETEYVLAALPLGGFVKMLGEGPDEQEAKSTDPRAYPNKSVGARMAIISAGVIMNVFLALGCFVYLYTKERVEIPAVLGAVSAGSLAYEAGLARRRRDRGDRRPPRPGLPGPAPQDPVQRRRPGPACSGRAPGARATDLAGHPAAPRPQHRRSHDRHSSRRRAWRSAVSSRRRGWSTLPRINGLEGKERETKVDVLVAAGPAGETPTPLASVARIRSPARPVRRPADHARHRAPASSCHRASMARRSSASS